MLYAVPNRLRCLSKTLFDLKSNEKILFIFLLEKQMPSLFFLLFFRIFVHLGRLTDCVIDFLGFRLLPSVTSLFESLCLCGTWTGLNLSILAYRGVLSLVLPYLELIRRAALAFDHCIHPGSVYVGMVNGNFTHKGPSEHLR